MMTVLNTANTLVVKLEDKQKVLVRSEKRGFFDITGCEPVTDGQIDDCNGLLVDAKWLSDQYVANLLASSDESAMIETSSTTRRRTRRS